MYLSNVDRERLGLQGYTSDVPADVVQAAEAALAAREGAAADVRAPKRKTAASSPAG